MQTLNPSKDVYRLDYNLEDAIFLTFKRFAFYPIVVNDIEEDKLNNRFRQRALTKYGNCETIRPALVGLKLRNCVQKTYPSNMGDPAFS